jgi:hypothetical protein
MSHETIEIDAKRENALSRRYGEKKGFCFQADYRFICRKATFFNIADLIFSR